jgi:hypothetical protein
VSFKTDRGGQYTTEHGCCIFGEWWYFCDGCKIDIDARVMYWQRLLIVDLGVIIDDSSNDSSPSIHDCFTVDDYD